MITLITIFFFAYGFLKSGDILSDPIVVGMDMEVIINDYYKGINIYCDTVALNNRPGNGIVEKVKMFKKV